MTKSTLWGVKYLFAIIAVILFTPLTYAASREERTCNGKIDMYRGESKIRIDCHDPPFSLQCDQTYGGFGNRSISCEQIGQNMDIKIIVVHADGFTAFDADGNKIVSGASLGWGRIVTKFTLIFKEIFYWFAGAVPEFWSVLVLFGGWIGDFFISFWSGVTGWFSGDGAENTAFRRQIIYFLIG